MPDLEALYRIINLLPMPVWGLLVFAPGANLTKQWVFSLRIHALLALIYGILFCWAVTQGPALSPDAFSTLSGLTSLFSSPLGVLVAWQHFLVFDLFLWEHGLYATHSSKIPIRQLLEELFWRNLDHKSNGWPSGFLLYFLFYYRSKPIK